MNPYDKAHELARIIRASSECQTMLQAKEAIMQDAAAARMMDDFERKQQLIYQQYQDGQMPESEQLAEMRTLMDIMRANSVLAPYLQADARLALLINDIQRIIVDSVSDTRWQVRE